MKEKLVEINTLLDLLGFTELRSAKRFCEQNKIPLFRLGKKTYTHEKFIDAYIENELELFVNANYPNPIEIMTAVKEEDNLKLLTAMESQPIEQEVKTQFKRNKSKMGKAAKSLLDQLKSA